MIHIDVVKKVQNRPGTNEEVMIDADIHIKGENGETLTLSLSEWNKTQHQINELLVARV